MIFETSRLLNGAGFVHGFGTRHASRKDMPRLVYTLRQVHGIDVVRLIPPFPDRRWRFAQADALVTAEPGVSVGVRTADCLPVLIAHPDSGAAAAVHCGWRSAAAGLAGRAIGELCRAAGAEPRSLLAALGPCIRACCYEVGPEVRAAFRSHTGAAACFTEQEGALRLDLLAAVTAELRSAGLPSTAIETVGGCTRCRPDLYHSWRGERARGRMVSWVTAKGSAQGAGRCAQEKE